MPHDLDGLKPINLIQAAEADFRRREHNAAEADYSNPSFEQYAFHRKHVRKAENVRGLLISALMDPCLVLGVKKTAKETTRLIYGNARLLLDAIKITTEA